MAWNQPGGNGGRDPWGNQGDQKGPPDLDEVLRKLQNQLGRIFGSKGGGPRSPGGGGFSSVGGIGIGVIIAAALLAWFFSGIYIVDPAERGVVLRFGKLVRTAEPGPHWVPTFFESVEKVDVQQVREQNIGFVRQGGSKTPVARESLMLTEDENIIDIQFAVQYRVNDPALFLFKVAEPELTLRQATESAVREIVGRTTMDFVITEGRNAVAAEAQTLIQDILDLYQTGLQITSVNMQDAQPPVQVQEAFFDAIKAREDQQRIINVANAYKADLVPKARGAATAITQKADAYRQRVIAQAEGDTARFLKVLEQYRKAPEVTRERLYLEALESVMVNSSKVLVDVQGSNNLMYLPIDKLLKRDGADAATGRGQPVDPGLSGSRPGFDNTNRSRDALRGRSR